METKPLDETIGQTVQEPSDTQDIPYRYHAGDLARRMADMMEADEGTRQEIMATALCAGYWLCEQGHAGRWDKLDPVALLATLDPLSPQHLNIFVCNLAGLAMHACLYDGMTFADARRIIDQLLGLATDPILEESLRHTLEHLTLPLV